jgi:hypothetical protein
MAQRPWTSLKVKKRQEIKESLNTVALEQGPQGSR